ncbi:MAG: flagellar hook-associated protein FlgK [Bacillota bacterium]|nr:flagellar hook-associated protein FlgK [Bacillota bacterium]
MRTTFSGLEIASRALASSQRALDVTGHNIANANAIGYTRQRVTLAATDPYTVASTVRGAQAGQVGTGVWVLEIKRLQNLLLAGQTRNLAAEAAAAECRQEGLSRLQAVINEPGENGLHSLLDGFWNSWQALSTDPADLALRAGCRAAATSLCDGFRRTATLVQSMRDGADEGLRAEVQLVNSLAREISLINDSIRRATQIGDNPNDLLDRRDVLLADLARSVDVRVHEYGDGSVAVTIGGFELVQQFGFQELAVKVDPVSGLVQAVWADCGLPVRVSGGKLAGLLEMRDQVYGRFLADLDSITAALAARVNEVHRTGYTLEGQPGGDFFDPSATGAINLSLAPGILDNLRNIATSGGGEPGDGSCALAISRIRADGLAGLGGYTVDGLYRGLVADIGVRALETDRQLETLDLLGRQVAAQLDREAGVSIDEELIDLMKHQHAYNAAARVLSAMDEMIATLLERLGAGR